MRFRTKLAIFLSICAIALGAVLALAVMLSINFEWERLETVPTYESVSKELLSPFDSIYIDQIDADIKIICTDAKFPVIQYMESEHVKYRVQTSDEGELHVEVEDSRRWYERFGIQLGKNEPATVLYLPQGEYKKLHVDTVSGDVTVSRGGVSDPDSVSAGNLKFSTVDVRTASGDILFAAELLDIAPMNLQSTSGEIDVKYATAGNISLKTASGDISATDCNPLALFVHSTSGDVELRNVNTERIHVETVSGDVAGKLLHTQVTQVLTNSGEVELESVHAAVSANIKTTSGEVSAVSSYAKELRVESTSGDVELRFDDGIDVETETTSGDVRLEPKDETNRGEGSCFVKTVSGDIFISRPPLSLWFN